MMARISVVVLALITTCLLINEAFSEVGTFDAIGIGTDASLSLPLNLDKSFTTSAANQIAARIFMSSSAPTTSDQGGQAGLDITSLFESGSTGVYGVALSSVAYTRTPYTNMVTAAGQFFNYADTQLSSIPGLQALDAHVYKVTNVPDSTMIGLEVGMHKAPPLNTTNKYGIWLYSNDHGPVLGATRADVGMQIEGNAGWTWAIKYFSTGMNNSPSFDLYTYNSFSYRVFNSKHWRNAVQDPGSQLGTIKFQWFSEWRRAA